MHEGVLMEGSEALRLTINFLNLGGGNELVRLEREKEGGKT